MMIINPRFAHIKRKTIKPSRIRKYQYVPSSSPSVIPNPRPLYTRPIIKPQQKTHDPNPFPIPPLTTFSFPFPFKTAIPFRCCCCDCACGVSQIFIVLSSLQLTNIFGFFGFQATQLTPPVCPANCSTSCPSRLNHT